MTYHDKLKELEQQEMDAWREYHHSCKVTLKLRLDWIKAGKELSKAKQTKQAPCNASH